MTLGPDSAATLVDYIDKSEWLKRADPDIRVAVLSYIGMAIMRIRIQTGQSPFDDGVGPLGDEPPNAFMIIRKMLTGI